MACTRCIQYSNSVRCCKSEWNESAKYEKSKIGKIDGTVSSNGNRPQTNEIDRGAQSSCSGLLMWLIQTQNEKIPGIQHVSKKVLWYQNAMAWQQATNQRQKSMLHTVANYSPVVTIFIHMFIMCIYYLFTVSMVLSLSLLHTLTLLYCLQCWGLEQSETPFE